MSSGAWMMTVAILLTFGSLAFLMFSMVRSIQNHRDPKRGVWREFGLGLSPMVLFFASWVAHEISEFVSTFSQSTLENWQSEFLQLFSFVVLAAMYIHKGSAESKDGEEKIEASLRRIEENLGTLPDDAPSKRLERWKLPETPLKFEDAGAAGKPQKAPTHAGG